MNATETFKPTQRVMEYLELWGKLMAEGLTRFRKEEVTLAPLAIEGGDSVPPTTMPEGLWMRFFGGKAGEQAIFLSAAEALRLAGWLGASNDSETSLTSEAREALVQFFQQIATLIPMRDWLGTDGELEASETQEPSWASAVQSTYRFSAAAGASVALQARLSQDFETALEHEVTPPPASPPAAKPLDSNLDLLMDVELEATLRFGGKEMLLGDVLNLVPGSVVELDQQIQDPVELVIGNKVIARGEVVTVDGNYGLRVTGLASRKERLESLRK